MRKMVGLILLALSFNLTAATLDGLTFPDTVNVDGRTLVLNGIGIRKATIFNIKVYYGALYLEQKSKEPNNFLTTQAPKQIIMHFVRDADAKKLKDAFIEGMKASNKNHESLKPQLNMFLSNVIDASKNDLFIITFTNDGVSLNNQGKQSEKILGAEFSRALLNIWFTSPRDENLRNGLLGL